MIGTAANHATVAMGEAGADPGDASVSTAAGATALVAVGDGRMDQARYREHHVRVVRGSKRAARNFLTLLGRAFPR